MLAVKKKLSLRLLTQDGLLLWYDSGADPGLLLLPPVRVHQGGGLAAQPQGPRPLQPQARGTHICRPYRCEKQRCGSGIRCLFDPWTRIQDPE